MTSQVRSVVVRLEAMVARYIRDVHRAGNETEKSFDKIHASTSKAREEFVAADRAAARLQQSTSRLGSTTLTTSSSQRRLATDVDRVSTAAARGTRSIDQYSGRLRVVAELIATLGPGLLPLGAGGLAAVGALAGLFGGAAVGALGLLGAVQGVGDALKVVEKARLEPTVENLQAAQDALSQLSPQAREFVTRFQELRPVLRVLRDAGAERFFPGLTDALDSLDRLAPTLQRFMAVTGQAGGDAVANAAESLTTDRWAPFLDFLTQEVPEAIENTTQLVGSLSHAGAELWMTFDPTNDRFVDWLSDVADGLDVWAGSAEGQQDIRDFLGYVEETGPKVADFVVAVADAFTQVVQAAAPLSGPVLEGLTSVANVVADVADSDLGTPLLAGVAALTLYNRSLQVAGALQTKLTGSTALSGAMASGGMFGMFSSGARSARSGVKSAVADLRTMRQEYTRLGATQAVVLSGLSRTTGAAERTANRMKTLGKTSAIVGGLAIASTGAADSIGLTNTASLALMGSFAGPWGAAIGGAIGGMRDLDAATQGFSDTVAEVEEHISRGKFAEAADELARLKAQAKDSNEMSGFGDALDDIGNGLERVATGDIGFLFGADEDKIRRLTKELKAAEQAAADQAEFDALAERYGTAGEKAGIAARQTQRLKTSIASLNALVDKQASWDGYADAIDNVTASVKENGRTLNSNTEAGRANRQSLRDLVTSGQQYAETLSGLDRVKFMRGLLAEFDAAVTKAGGATQATRDLRQELSGELGALRVDVNTDAIRTARESVNGFEDLLGNLDGVTATPTVDINKQPFDAKGSYVQNYLTMISGKGAKPKVTLQGVGAAEASLSGLTRPRTISIIPRVMKMGIGPVPVPGAPVQQADGGTVQGPRYPYGDKVLTYLAPGEEVITNRRGEADRFRADRAAGRIPAYADGGTVQGLAGGGTVRTRSHSDREADHVARGLKKMRQELASATKALEKETEARDALVDRRNNLREGVRGGLDRGIWRPGGDDDVWTSSGDPVAALYAQLADINKFDALSGRLKKKVSTAAFEEIVKDGDVATLQAYDALPTAQLATFSKLYGVVQSRLSASSKRASDAVYAAPIAKANARLAETTREVKALRRDVQHAVKSGEKQAARTRAAAKKGASAAATRQHRGYVK